MLKGGESYIYVDKDGSVSLKDEIIRDINGDGKFDAGEPRQRALDFIREHGLRRYDPCRSTSGFFKAVAADNKNKDEVLIRGDGGTVWRTPNDSSVTDGSPKTHYSGTITVQLDFKTFIIAVKEGVVDQITLKRPGADDVELTAWNEDIWNAAEELVQASKGSVGKEDLRESLQRLQHADWTPHPIEDNPDDL